MYIDTHAHLNYKDKYGDTDALVAEISASGVKKVIGVGWDLASSELAAKQAEKYPSLYLRRAFTLPTLRDIKMATSKGSRRSSLPSRASPSGK